MKVHILRWIVAFASAIVWLTSVCGWAQTPGTSSSTSAKHGKRSPAGENAALDDGSVVNGIYRNAKLKLACAIPAGWVLRTEEMNARDETGSAASPASNAAPKSKVLLAAFSRPPEAHGEEVNGSILIATEPVSTYPGLKEAAQYIGPISEVAKAQGFTQDEDPYEIAIGSKVVVRGDFHKDVGTRVIRQSTLAMLEHDNVVSITIIGGTEDEVEGLIDGLEFGSSPRSPRPAK